MEFVSSLAPRNLIWLVDVWKICAPTAAGTILIVYGYEYGWTLIKQACPVFRSLCIRSALIFSLSVVCTLVC